MTRATDPRNDRSDTAARPMRPPELEDWLNRRLYHPASWRLALAFRHTPLTPNAVSVLAGLCVVLAACIYGFTSGPAWAAVAMVLLIAWHILDGADGDLARLTGRESALGELVDGLCDYVSHVALYFALSMVMAEQWGIVGFAIMAAAGFARGFQTVFFETQRRQYLWWVHGKSWLRVTAEKSSKDGARRGGAVQTYLNIGAYLAAGGERLDAALGQLATDQRRSAARVVERHVLAPLQSLSLLSSNYRSLVIGLAMIAGLPLVIVVFELGVLSLLALWRMRAMRRAIASATEEVLAASDQGEASSSR